MAGISPSSFVLASAADIHPSVRASVSASVSQPSLSSSTNRMSQSAWASCPSAAVPAALASMPPPSKARAGAVSSHVSEPITLLTIGPSGCPWSDCNQHRRLSFCGRERRPGWLFQASTYVPGRRPPMEPRTGPIHLFDGKAWARLLDRVSASVSVAKAWLAVGSNTMSKSTGRLPGHKNQPSTHGAVKGGGCTRIHNMFARKLCDAVLKKSRRRCVVARRGMALAQASTLSLTL